MTGDPGMNSDQSDLLWQASITDETSPFFEKFDQNVEKTTQSATQGFGNVGASAGSMGVQIGAIAGIVSGLTTKVLEAASQGIQAFDQWMTEADALASKFDEMGIALDVVAGNTGIDKQQVDQYTKSLTDMGLSGIEAEEVLTKLAQNQVNLNQVTQLTTVAQNASVISGQSVDQTMNQIVQSVDSLYTRQLRQLGLTVDLTAAYKVYAEEHHVQADDLDLVTKRNIALNAVIEAGTTISGTYAAAQDTVAVQQDAMATTSTNLKIAFGQVFQGAQIEAIKDVNVLLTDMLTFLDNNKDALKDISVTGGVAMHDLISILTSVLDVVGQAEKLWVTFEGDVLETGATVLGVKTQFDGFISRLDDLKGILITIIQVLSLASAGTVVLKDAINDVVDDASHGFLVLEAIVTRNKAAFDELTNSQAINARNAQQAKQMQDDYNAAILNGVDAINQINSADASAVNANGALLTSEQELANAVNSFGASLSALNQKLQDTAADTALKKARQNFTEALQISQQEEDMARNFADSIQQIENNSNDQRVQDVKNYADQRLQIELDHQRALRNLQEQFEFTADDDARSRDAVKLLADIRKHNEDVTTEKQSYQDKLKDAKTAYDKTIQDLNDNLQKQIDQANKAYQKQEDDFQRSNDRKKQLQAIQDQWTQEDLQKSIDKQVQALVNQFASMTGVTQDGLEGPNGILSKWQKFFPDLKGLIDEYYQAITTEIGGLAGGSVGTPTGGSSTSSTPTFGQAGIVSDMLTPQQSGSYKAAALESAPVSRLPAANAGGAQTKHIIVEIQGNGLDPYYQRSLVTSLLEVERNSG